MARVFVDPMIRSRRLELVQTLAFGGILFVFLIVIWIKYLVGGGSGAFRMSLMLSSIVAAAFGVGYYMLKRNRGVMIDRMWLSVDDVGIRSMTPAGIVEVGWSEVIEVRIGMRPSRNRAPDILIKTEGGYVSAFMRWVDESGTVPEPSLTSPGLRFINPDGDEYMLGPENSQLVAALKEHVAPERIKEGVMVSL
jgi:hypothetical protein